MMDLKIEGQFFVVTGASSGLGRAVAETLMDNGAPVLAVARREQALKEMEEKYPGLFEYLVGDITTENAVSDVVEKIGKRRLSGLFVNAGGPPAMSFEETAMQNWDDAYRTLLRWKVDLVKSLVPVFKGGERLGHETLFWEHLGNCAVRQGKWKLVADGRLKEWELYDLESDRTETDNLVQQYPDKAAKMKQMWQKWADEVQVYPKKV